MLIVAVVIFLIIASLMIFMDQPQFGKILTGTQLNKIKNSPNYREGKFQNLNFTPDIKEGVSYLTVIKDFFFHKSKRSRPASVLPSVKSDLHTLPADKNFLIWFGHSSYFLQIDDKRILVDPVFSGNASPVNFTTKSFAGSDVYGVADMPLIDYLFITHDHWDHLDHKTIVTLKAKVNKVITGLGVGAHLQMWGFDKNNIIEKDWNEEVNLDPGFIVNTTSARHFSGRTFKRDQSLWSSFVLTTPSMKVFIGGDSGYDTHFKTIGEKFGPIDLAVLECGQYNEYWKYIHMMPEEAVQAAQDLKAKKLMPVHWGKFSLALHAWDEPIKRITAESRKKNVPLITPMIGEAVDLKSDDVLKEWWMRID